MARFSQLCVSDDAVVCHQLTERTCIVHGVFYNVFSARFGVLFSASEHLRPPLNLARALRAQPQESSIDKRTMAPCTEASTAPAAGTVARHCRCQLEGAVPNSYYCGHIRYPVQPAVEFRPIMNS